jgi:tetratricopeptide (TPR) repeat protein
LCQNTAAYIGRAKAYLDTKQYEQAISDYDKALELDPKDAWIYYHKAIACEESGRIREAIEAYNGVIQYAPLLRELGVFGPDSISIIARQGIQELEKVSSPRPSVEEQSEIQVSGIVFCNEEPWSFGTIYFVDMDKTIGLRDAFYEDAKGLIKVQIIMVGVGVSESKTNKNGGSPAYVVI